MKFSVLQDQLKEALAIVTRAVDNRPTIPALANVLIRTDESRIQIVGTNIEHTVSVFVGARVDQPGEITLPAKTLLELVNNLAPERIDVSLNEGTSTVTMKCGGAKSSLKGLHADDFPPIRAPLEPQIEIPAEQFAGMIKGVIICVAKSDSRPILTGVYAELENGCLTLASADGYRLAVLQTPIKSDARFTHVIPSDVLRDFARVLGDDGAGGIAFDGGSVHLSYRNVTASALLLEGKFPDFNNILPRHWNTRATFYTADLLRACKRAEIFARDSNYSVRMALTPAPSANEPGEVQVIGKSAERGDLEASLDAKVEGDSLLAAYNVRFMMDILNVISTEQVVFDSDGDKHPCTLAPADSNGAVTYVVMPMSINR